MVVDATVETVNFIIAIGNTRPRLVTLVQSLVMQLLRQGNVYIVMIRDMIAVIVKQFE